MSQREATPRTEPASCSECGNIFVAGVSEEKGAYMMGREHCSCGSDEFELIGSDNSATETTK